jgi:hypothetical protein
VARLVLVVRLVVGLRLGVVVLVVKGGVLGAVWLRIECTDYSVSV